MLPAFIFSCTKALPESGRDSAADSDYVKTYVTLTKSAASSENGWLTDIFIYNDDRAAKLDTYQRSYTGTDGNVAAVSRQGDKIMAVIVNPWKKEYAWEEISSFEALTRMYADMKNDDREKPVMSGIHRFTASTSDNSVYDVSVSPMTSEIYLRHFRCDFSSTPYSGAVMEDVSVYLANVNTLARLFLWEGFVPEAPMNTQGTIEGATDGTVVNSEMIYAKIPGQIGVSGIRPEIKLYCYPNECEEDNPGSPFTRIVITGMILGQRYYYPININRGDFGETGERAGISRNSSYTFDVVIRRTGALTPDEAVGPETLEIRREVAPWTETDETEIVF